MEMDHELKEMEEICPICKKPYLEKKVYGPPPGSNKKIICYVHDYGKPDIKHAPGLNAIITMNHTDGCYDEQE